MSASEIAFTPKNLPPPPAEFASPATVLLVEDDKAIRRYLQVILERAGFRVVVASDGLEAMKVALNAAINVVVTDAIMPNLGGQELCRFLRSHPQLKQLPLLLLSGSERTAARAGETQTADAYLAKPVRAEELTSCIERLLAQSESDAQTRTSPLAAKSQI